MLDRYIDVWTPKIVGEELVEAVRWAQAAAGPVGPARFKATMPEPYFLTWERVYEGWDEELPPDATPPRRRPYPPARISFFERVLWWPSEYLRGHDGPARVLKVWVRCKVFRVPFNKEVDRRGWNRATAYRQRDRALALISMGLASKGVPLPR